MGHLQAVCPGDKGTQVERQKPEKQQGQRKYKSIRQLQTDEALEENHIWVITGGHKEGYRLQVLINGKPVQMELDTGATVSVISEHEWNQLFPVTNNLQPYTGKPLRGYSEKQLDIAEQATVQVIYEWQVTDLPLVIIAGRQRPALFG